jgi:hypothetical protein
LTETDEILVIVQFLEDGCITARMVVLLCEIGGLIGKCKIEELGTGDSVLGVNRPSLTGVVNSLLQPREAHSMNNNPVNILNFMTKS